jgi:hypothetical protein
LFAFRTKCYSGDEVKENEIGEARGHINVAYDRDKCQAVREIS